jgi:hypothetical protein
MGPSRVLVYRCAVHDEVAELLKYWQETDWKNISYGQHSGNMLMGMPTGQGVRWELPRGSWAVLGRRLGRLLIGVLFSSSTIIDYPPLHDPSCLQPPSHPYRSPTLRPFSTPLCNLTNVKPNKTYPPIRFLSTFNPAIPQRLSSPSFESRSPHSTNLKMAMKDSQIGSRRP